MAKANGKTTRQVEWANKDYIIEMLEEAIDWLENDKIGKKTVIQAELALFLGVPNSRLSELRTRYCNIVKIVELFEKIDNIFEIRLVKPALDKRTSGNFTRFLLVNKYQDKYKEKQTVEHEAKGSLVDAIRELSKND